MDSMWIKTFTDKQLNFTFIDKNKTLLTEQITLTEKQKLTYHREKMTNNCTNFFKILNRHKVYGYWFHTLWIFNVWLINTLDFNHELFLLNFQPFLLPDSVTNGTYVNYAMDKIAEVKNIDISPYVTSFSVPEEYNTVYSNLKETGMSGLTSLWERKELDGVRGKLISVYQQVGILKKIDASLDTPI